MMLLRSKAMSIRLAILFVLGTALASPHNLEARQVAQGTSTLLVIQTVQVTSSVFITQTPGATPPGPLRTQPALISQSGVSTTVYATAPGPLVTQSSLYSTVRPSAVPPAPLVSQSALTSAAPPPPLVSQSGLLASSSAISFGAAPPNPLVAQTSLIAAPVPARSSPPVVSAIPPGPLVTQSALVGSQPAVVVPSVAPVPGPQPQGSSSRALVAPAPSGSAAAGVPGVVTTTRQASATSQSPAQYTGAAGKRDVSVVGASWVAGVLGFGLVFV